MIVESLVARNLLTFQAFEFAFDEKATVVVGPNGAGKSNVVRLLDLVQKALESVEYGTAAQPNTLAARQVLASFAAARHFALPPDADAEVRLAVRFTTAAERLLLLTYLRAAILHTLMQDLSSGAGFERRAELAAWVEREIGQEQLAPLAQGVIVLRHRGLPQDPWEITYEFRFGDRAYTWVLAAPDAVNVIHPADDDARLRPAPYRVLAERLLDVANPGNRPIALPMELPAFYFARLCPDTGEAAPAPTLLLGTGVFSRDHAPFRAAITLLGIPAEPRSQQPFPLSYLLGILLNDGMIVVGEQLRGLGTGGSAPRQPGPYPWQALSSPGRSHASWLLPLRLFELKNGNAQQRARFEQIQQMFSELAPGRSIDVTFQATALGGPPVSPLGAGQVAVFGQPEPDAANAPAQPGAVITVAVGRTGGDRLHPDALPIQLHGAGTWEALVLAEALAEAPGRFVVFDEPAVTLHPSWQRLLRARIKRADGQFLLITHSADLVAMDDQADLLRLVRLENEAGHTRIHRFTAGTLTVEETDRITRDFALSTDAVSLLFARGVVLVEGETELGVLPAWFEQAAQAAGLPGPGKLDLAFWSVGSDTHFRPYLTVLHALAIPYVVVCDGNAFEVEKRQHRSHIFRQALDGGLDAPLMAQLLADFDAARRPRIMTRRLFEMEKRIAGYQGIYTLAPGWSTADKTAGTPNDERFEAFIETILPGRLAQAAGSVGDSKVRQGRWLAARDACPSEVSALYTRALAAFVRRGLTV